MSELEGNFKILTSTDNQFYNLTIVVKGLGWSSSQHRDLPKLISIEQELKKKKTKL